MADKLLFKTVILISVLLFIAGVFFIAGESRACAPDPPVAVLTAETCKVPVDVNIIFDGNSSYDIDGTIVHYEWDFDYNDINFEPDYNEVLGNAPDGDFDGNTPHSYSLPGTYKVRLRVTDNDSLTDTDDFIVYVNGIYYVDEDAAPGGDGKSWDEAFEYLQDALDAVVGGDEIWVAKGTYYPDDGDSVTENNRHESFGLVSDVNVWGGFENGDYWEHRDPEDNVTTLSGNIGAAGVNTDNSYHVVTGADDVTIDGFTITRGYANYYDYGQSWGHFGGGLLNNAVNPTVSNCKFTYNYAQYGGGGVFNVSADSVVITDCSFSNNSAYYYGGGIMNRGSDSTVTNCIFTENSTVSQCGGAFDDYLSSDSVVSNCMFIDNTAGYYGGAINIGLQSGTTVESCVFFGNTATSYGGGAVKASQATTLKLVNCTFSGNSAGRWGGAIFLSAVASMDIINCILWGDSAGTSDDEIYTLSSNDPDVSYSDIEGCGGSGAGWDPNFGNDGGNNIDSDPCFVNASDPDGGDDIYCTWDDGLRLTIDSNCIDAADGDQAPDNDILGHGRCDIYTKDNTGGGDPNYADMGAYEVVEFKFTASADNRPYDTANRNRWKHALTQMRDIDTGREAGIGEFHILCGDLDAPATTHGDLQDYFDNNDILWYPVIGNHEQEEPVDMAWIRAEYDTGHNDSRGPLKNFTNQDGPTGSVETTYSFDYGNAHFIVLNQYWDGNTTAGSDRALSNGDIVDELYKWLIEDLYSNTKSVVFVAAHEPAFPQYRHFNDGFTTKTVHRDRFWKVLNDRKVVAYFCGHTHFYYSKQVCSNDNSHYSWEPFTWQIDTGNIGNDSDVRQDWDLPAPNHDPDIQTFVDVTVRGNSVQFSPWRGAYGNTYEEEYPWTAAVPSDTTAPTIESVTAADANTVVVVFSEWVDAASANKLSNYTISIDDNDVNVVSAVLDHDDLDPDYDYKRVTLTIDKDIYEGAVCTLTVNNVKDLAGNVIDANSTENFMLIEADDSGWKAYNDCERGSGDSTSANATDWTIYDGKTDHYTGLLKNITTSSTTGMPTVTFSASPGNLVGDGDTGDNPASGTDAHDIFDGFIDFDVGGHISYSDTSGWWIDITFTNLDPDAEYTFVGTTIRNVTYDDRFTLCTISGITSCDNNSSSGIHDPDGLGSYINGNETSYLACYDSDILGYVVRWDNIKCGPDGSFKVRTQVDEENPNQESTDTKAYPFSGFMLEKEGDSNTPQITGHTPLDDATGIPANANLTADVNDSDDGLMKVAFYGRKVEEDFTIIALPDTQKYVQYPATQLVYFEAQTDWVVDEKDNENIVFVTHEGDIVQNYNNIEQEWIDANNVMSVLDGNVPYGLLPGNHDLPPTLYNEYFPYTRYENESWYGGHCPDNGNENNYQLFSAGGMDFVILHIEYPPQTTAAFETWAEETLTWANTVLKSYPNRKAIITTHSMINTSGTLVNRGKEIWNALIMPNQNVYLALCGHVPGAKKKTHNPVCGHDVHILLANYQSDPNGGNGFLRVMKFEPNDDTIDVNTFSPYIADNDPTGSPYKTDSENDFDLTVPMDNDFEVIGTDFVAGDNTASMTWTGLDAETEYEWYVVVTDSSGNVVSSSSVLSFTTDDF